MTVCLSFESDFFPAWWEFKRLAQVVDQTCAKRIPTVQASWSAMRQRRVEEQSDIHAAAQALWPVNPDAARAVLTRFGSERALEVCASADKLAETVAARGGP